MKRDSKNSSNLSSDQSPWAEAPTYPVGYTSPETGCFRHILPPEKIQAIREGLRTVSREEIVARLRANGVCWMEFLEATDATSEADRIWFEQHPQSRELIRDMTPSEIMLAWAAPGYVVTGGLTYVEQIFPGIRLRRQIWVYVEPIERSDN